MSHGSPQVGDTVQITGVVVGVDEDCNVFVELKVGPKRWYSRAICTVIARAERPLGIGDDVILSNGFVWTIAAVDGHEAWVRRGVGSKIVPLSELRRA